MLPSLEVKTFVCLFFILGDLTLEEDVLDWLVTQKNLGEEDDVIEDVTAKSLARLIDTSPHFAVLFCKAL